MRVPIHQDMMDKAQEYADKIALTRTIQSKPNYTALTQDNRYYAGYLGELAFLETLTDKKYDYSVRTDGQSDKEDITLYYKNIPLRVDVKTATHPSYKYIMFPSAQAHIKYDYYVGVRLNGDVAIIEGYCKFNDFTLYKKGEKNFKIDTYATLFAELTPITKMLNLIDNETR